MKRKKYCHVDIIMKPPNGKPKAVNMKQLFSRLLQADIHIRAGITCCERRKKSKNKT